MSAVGLAARRAFPALLTLGVLVDFSLGAIAQEAPTPDPAETTDAPSADAPMDAPAGDATAPADGEAPADAVRELENLGTLALPQQRDRARAFIEKYPNSEQAVVVRRMLDEYAAYNRLADEEAAARTSRAAYNRAFWWSRCCPLPPWHPPVGVIANRTGEPILYQQRLGGIHQTRWTGPFRMPPGGDHGSPVPFLIRYLTPAGFQVRWVMPGESLAWTGSPKDGTLDLVPAPPPAELPASIPGISPPPPAEPEDPQPLTLGPTLIRS